VSKPDTNRGAVIVTGAGSGIGAEITRMLLARGTTVSAWDIKPGDLSRVNDANLMVHEVDTRDKAAVEHATAATKDRFGAVTGLSACAGIFRPKPFLEVTEDEWNEHFNINLKGVLFCCQAVLPVMRAQQSGSIVLWSSGLGRSPKPRTAHYAATKGGILGLTRVLALETAKQGIRVNCISPGIADTAMPRAVYPDETMEARAQDNPMKRLATANDMAEAALFLLDDESSYFTGQDIRVNGGKDLF
jgi:2-hydroxycyclohexanecarboxyl-CoA dehydrogenase